ncbi:NTP transferase domain-containing protein [Natrinema halophilum]|uniref:Phosphocholine cytidylyltransferase family protein n=1 Tax=Natrinema halophilum TaxID=1699371 RepID=A0A7D5GLN6_9EURY|nr:phosphocholine cytidylyltransferase family protein [Natrinema halophilum]QLG47853.1 phosphocholine cytidylyltransferase family protein [Natrinema halophilum]
MVADAVTWLCLAAGQGTRLRPITDDKPKAMVSVADRSLLSWLLDTARHTGIEDRAVVTGYLGDSIDDQVDDDVTIHRNPDYANTDMVRSLWCGSDSLEGTVVISYSDILYTPTVLKTVLEDPRDVVVAVDEDWQSYWTRRHEEPVEDAESLAFDGDRITSIGERVESIDAPEAQYIGLMKFSPAGIDRLRETYAALERAEAEGVRSTGTKRSFEDIHMTDLLQGMIERDVPVHAARIQGGWVEIDTPRDLDIARSVCTPTEDGTLNIDRSEFSG